MSRPIKETKYEDLVKNSGVRKMSIFEWLKAGQRGARYAAVTQTGVMCCMTMSRKVTWKYSMNWTVAQ